LRDQSTEKIDVDPILAGSFAESQQIATLGNNRVHLQSFSINTAEKKITYRGR
jgi:hypothetical protein